VVAEALKEASRYRHREEALRLRAAAAGLHAVATQVSVLLALAEARRLEETAGRGPVGE
jgi:hypothetical protein